MRRPLTIKLVSFAVSIQARGPMNVLKWTLFIFFSILIGLYPFTYWIFDMSQGLLASKSVELLQSNLWNTSFYVHISLGAISMLTGWSQFIKGLRNRNLNLHRTIGKVYLIAVALSGLGGLYIALFASGGMVSVFGFSGLALAWLFTTSRAYLSIRNKDVDRHQYWMIRSYALCWAAVTLRMWLPLLQFALGMEFLTAYRIIAWLCWVPNLVVAELIITSLKKDKKILNPASKAAIA
jgi:hypothetical protein